LLALALLPCFYPYKMHALCGSCNRYSKLLSQFFCGHCKSLRCCHPNCTSELADFVLCPKCLRRWPASENEGLHGRCSFCPGEIGFGELGTENCYDASLGILHATLTRSKVLNSLTDNGIVATGRYKRPLPGALSSNHVGTGIANSMSAAEVCHVVGGAGDAGISTSFRKVVASDKRVEPGNPLGIRLLPLLSRRCKPCTASGRSGLLLCPSTPTVQRRPACEVSAGDEYLREWHPELRLYQKNSAASFLFPSISLLPVDGSIGSIPTFFQTASVCENSSTPLRVLFHESPEDPAVTLHSACLHLANPTAYPLGVVLKFSGFDWKNDWARVGKLTVGVGAERATFVLGPMDELEGLGEEGNGAGNEENHPVSFPWPPDMHPILTALPPSQKSCDALVPLSLKIETPQGCHTPGTPLCVPLECYFYLHPFALGEWAGQSPLAHAHPVKCPIVLQLNADI